MLNDGTIELTSGFVLGPAVTLDAFLRSEEGKGAQRIGQDSRRGIYIVRCVKIGSRVFNLELRFCEGMLETIGLSEEGGSWNTFVEGQVDREKAKNDRWLNAVLGLESDAAYSWGTLKSLADYKTGEASIVLSYRGDP